MGSRGEVPCQGHGDEIPIVPQSRSEKETRISAEPKATIEIPVKIERISAIIAEILLYLCQNRNCRLTAPLRFPQNSASHMGYVGLPPKPAWGFLKYSAENGH